MLVAKKAFQSSLVFILALSLVLTIWAPAGAAISTMVLVSGSGSGGIGSVDANTTYTLDDGTTGNALLTANHPYYATIPGARWVNTTGTNTELGDRASNKTVTYSFTFELPAEYESVSFNLLLLADNYASVKLNDVLIGQQPQTGDFANFMQISTFSSSDPANFHPGVNTVTIVNTDLAQWNGVSYKAYVNIPADTTAPVASPVVSPAPNAAGWHNTAFTIDWNWVEDAGGAGIDPADCTTQTATGTYNTNSTVTATCRDLAGNPGVASQPIKVDRMAPRLNPVVSPNPVAWNGTAVVTPNAYDSGFSGLASVVCGTPDTSTGGQKTVSCTATDVAGNSTTVTVPYTVSFGFGFGGFTGPVDAPPVVNTGKAGRTYPVKWQLTDVNNNIISDLNAIDSITYKATTCGAFTGDPLAALETEVTGGTSLRYDSATNQFIYNWATPSTPGCYTLFVNLDDGQVFHAYFNFNK